MFFYCLLECCTKWSETDRGNFSFFSGTNVTCRIGNGENPERALLLRETSITSYGSSGANGHGASSSSLPPDSGVQSEADDDEHVVFAVTPTGVTAAAAGDVIATNGVKVRRKADLYYI